MHHDLGTSAKLVSNATDVPPTMLSHRILQHMRDKNKTSLTQTGDPLSQIGGALAVHCTVDLEQGKVIEAASMATLFKGYESLLPGRALNQVGLVSSTASGICGGVHATASALCLEMGLGLKPPPLGIVLRNLLLSCQYLNDNSMHLYVLAGPDYSEHVIATTNPEIWQKARQSHCQHAAIHGYRHIADIMHDLNKVEGKLYKEALKMVSLARKAYIILGGKYPHSESIVAGGVTIDVDAQRLQAFSNVLKPFVQFSQKTAAIWDDIFDFMVSANPRYADLGLTPATMLDFGQWDHPNYYDADYKNCDLWGSKRWSTPAVVIDGKLQCDQLSLLNAGMEEFLDYSYRTRKIHTDDPLITHDPLGHAISENHPWNKRLQNSAVVNPAAYSWGSSLTWQGHGFEVGAYSRLYLTAIARKLPPSQYLHTTGNSLDFAIHFDQESAADLSWKVPKVWNAFERNRARAYALSFSLAVTLENIDLAFALLNAGNTKTFVPLQQTTTGRRLGVGLWGASRGFLAHWAVIDNQHIDNYQISIPSRVNVGTRTPTQELGPLEKALNNTPILETRQSHISDFQAIDIQRTIQSFDPCMTCSAHVLVQGSDIVLDKEIDTSFPV